jgi:predicted short-subunit dehydrogenase-like oxidoreductase (DUF2520 family)
MKQSRQRSQGDPRSRLGNRRRITIIGGGRLGTALGIALRRAGYNIALVVTRHSRTAQQAAKAIGGGVIGIAASEANFRKHIDRLAGSSLILITTPDNAIKRTAATIARLIDQADKHPKLQTVLHTSGALSSAELGAMKRPGVATGSLHPLVAIAKKSSAAATFENSFFCVEGDAKAVHIATDLVHRLHGRPFKIDPADKPLYHAAAVMAAGNVVALFEMAAAMLQACGISPQKSRQILLPLIKSSIANLDQMDSANALSGPLVRDDTETVKKHVRAMKSRRLTLALQVYRALGKETVAILRSGGKRSPGSAAKLF